MPIAWATFVAAASVSLASVYVAKRLRAHPKAFTVAAVADGVNVTAAETDDATMTLTRLWSTP